MISQISLREQFLWLMSQENVNWTNEIAKFITQSMKLRSEESEKMSGPSAQLKKEVKTTTTTKSKK